MSKLNAVSIFSGAGGLDIGLERAGLRTVSMCEMEPRCTDTLRANAGVSQSDGNSYFKTTKVLTADVREVSGIDLSLGESIDLLVGGPPCQTFSSAGSQKGKLDPRGQLLDEYVRITKEIRPRAFLLENVRGLVTARDNKGRPGGVIRQLHSALEDCGYSVRASLMNAADFGEYQRRVRCFLIGVDAGTAPDFPRATHFNPRELETSLFGKPWQTLGQFLQGHADDSGEYTFPTDALRGQLESLPCGSGLKSKGKAEPTRPGGHWGYRQGTFIADLAKPARTVTGSSSQDWIRWGGLLRRLTRQEVIELQGFPVSWEFCGTKAQQFKQIGNAVPPVFGELLGSCIARFLKSNTCTETTAVPLPQKFESYIRYTERDHERNESARQVHLQFE